MDIKPGLGRYSFVAVFLTSIMLATILLNLRPVVTRADSAGYALQFNGTNDFVELAATTLMIGPTWKDTKTIEFWVKPQGNAETCAIASPAWCDAVFGDRPRWWGVSRGVMGGLDRIWVMNYDGSSGSPMDLIAVEYVSDQWMHLALVHENGMLSVYKNGSLVGSVPSGTTVQPNTGAYPVLHLGGIIINSTRNWTFEGQLDEVRIWNIGRSQAELQADMQRTITGSEAGLTAYYQMSDGAGAMLTDDSVNNWNGTLYDGSRYVPADGQLPQWVISTAFGDTQTTPTPTSTATFTSEPASPTPTFTLGPPTDTPTITPEPPTSTPTFTPGIPTNTPTFTPQPPTATPTFTPAAGDPFFADGFESGDLSAWSSSATGGGDLSVSAAAALDGGYGLQILINDTASKYVVNDSPAAESHYRAHFLFDPNSLQMGNMNNHVIFQAYQGANQIHLRIAFQFVNGQYQLQAQVLDSNNIWRLTPNVTIADEAHIVEVEWTAAINGNDGSLIFSVDGQPTTISGLSSTRVVDLVRLGSVAGLDAATLGTYYFDNFASYR